MKIIATVDKSNGMLFNKRRVSKDSVVIQKILELFSNTKVLASLYTSELFEPLPDNFVIVDDYSDAKRLEANDEDIACFIENMDTSRISGITEAYIFNWNRDYPSDTIFSQSLLENLVLDSEEEFAGTSHDRITLSIYKSNNA